MHALTPGTIAALYGMQRGFPGSCGDYPSRTGGAAHGSKRLGARSHALGGATGLFGAFVPDGTISGVLLRRAAIARIDNSLIGMTFDCR